MTAPDPAEAFSDPLRGPERSRRFWSTVNAAEALPGVPTPLNWTWYDEGTDNAMIRGQVRIGTLPAGTVQRNERDERHLGIFFGHAAVNVDLWRRMADAVPGTSGAAFERDILGAERPAIATRPLVERYPVVAVKAPRAFAGARRQLVERAADHHQWWRAAVAGVSGAGEDAARAAFAAAFADYEEVATAHLVATIAAQGLFDALGRVCAKCGCAGLERELTSGLGTEEAVLLRRLWELSRGRAELEAFLREFGYQGPGAAELAGSSWRDAPALLDPVLARYRSLPEDAAPALIEVRQVAERDRAEQRLLDAVPRVARAPARGLLALVRAFLPLRESGRGAILRSIDAGRAAAKAIGAHAAAAGTMAAPEDVFMCTLAELCRREPMPSAAQLSFRRERWESYKLMEIPSMWDGVPEATRVTEPAEEAPELTLSGIGVSGGAVEAPARVVTDPAVDSELEPGEILVCHTTDPSWASLFLFAGGVVIDIGGSMSHGAIVARELGIPCVINTKDGTRRLRTGDRVRVDGSAGTVERVSGV